MKMKFIFMIYLMYWIYLMSFIYVIHLMCWNYLIDLIDLMDLITHNRNRNSRNNSRDWNNKGGARFARAPLRCHSPRCCFCCFCCFCFCCV